MIVMRLENASIQVSRNVSNDILLKTWDNDCQTTVVLTETNTLRLIDILKQTLGKPIETR